MRTLTSLLTVAGKALTANITRGQHSSFLLLPRAPVTVTVKGIKLHNTEDQGRKLKKKPEAKQFLEEHKGSRRAGLSSKQQQ